MDDTTPQFPPRFIWGAATPYASDCGGDSDGELPDLDLKIVQLMADGLTDAAIGARLGMSDRAVRKHASLIYQHLGAETVSPSSWDVCLCRSAQNSCSASPSSARCLQSGTRWASLRSANRTPAASSYCGSSGGRSTTSSF